MATHHADPGEVVDLHPMRAELKSARTTAIVKSDDFEAIRLVVQAGKEIAPHRVAGKITLHCLDGRVQLGVAGSTIDLAAGQWLYLDGGVEHSVRGVEDSSVLLTILFTR